MDEILLTVGLKASKSSQSQNVSGGLDQGNNVDESANSPISGFFDFDEGPIKPSAITSGIAKIAGGMENILQKLKLQVKTGLQLPYPLHVETGLYQSYDFLQYDFSSEDNFQKVPKFETQVLGKF